MPNPCTADALTAIGTVITAQQDAGYALDTVRLRGTLLTEYLEHVLNEEKFPSLTAEELVQPERASWFDAAGVGATRRRNTTGPAAAAAHDSQRARIQTYNAFTGHLGLSLTLPYPASGHRDRLEPEQAHTLLRAPSR